MTLGSVLAAVLGVAVIPAASAQRQEAGPPAACAGLVVQLADNAKKVIDPLAANPPTPDQAAAPLGDVILLMTSMTAARCLPPPPLSVPASTDGFRGPELCLSHSMAAFAGSFSVLSKVVPGAVPPDAGKLRAEAQGWAKAIGDVVTNCGLPAPAEGMPAFPKPTA